MLSRLDLLTQPWPLDHKRPHGGLGKWGALAHARPPSEPWGRVLGGCGCSSLMSSGSRIIQGTEVSRLLARQTGCCSSPRARGAEEQGREMSAEPSTAQLLV